MPYVDAIIFLRDMPTKANGDTMLIFLSYAMGLKDSDLRNSFKMTQQSNQQISDPC